MTREDQIRQINVKIEKISEKIKNTYDQIKLAEYADMLTDLNKQLDKINENPTEDHNKTTIIDAPIIADSKYHSATVGGGSTVVKLF